LTNRMQDEAKTYFDKLDEMGGMVQAIERGFPQGEIHRAALAYQKEVDRGDRIIVGVNAFTEPEDRGVPILKIKRGVEKKQVQKLKQRKKTRKNKTVASALEELAKIAQANRNLMPALMDAVRAEATLGEICDVFRRVYGEYRESASL
ncbi:MAG TPA: methylmalonyl-CoA mutase family protein, partial [Candidatus Binatia bacterium]|nr:methylmalonyl-CoA mutase family protein [Candidatus Binatia bacterium]